MAEPADTVLIRADQRNITAHDNNHYRAGLDAALAALRPEMRRAYEHTLRQFGEFCAAHGWSETPSADVLEAWQADMPR